MNHTPPSASGPEGAVSCSALPAELARLEGAPAGSISCDEARNALTALGRHLASCPACLARHGVRYRRIESVWALRGRCVPEGIFDDFYATVRERVPYGPVGGGMSTAFLDAPRSLRLWRSAALAASVLLVAAAGFVVTRAGDEATASPPEVRPLHDPRERLLQAYESPPDTLDVRPVHAAGTRGHDGFWGDPPTQPVSGNGVEAWR